MISGGIDCFVRVYDINKNYPRYSMKGHLDNIQALEILSENLVASASKDHTIHIFNYISGFVYNVLRGNGCSVLTIAKLLINPGH